MTSGAIRDQLLGMGLYEIAIAATPTHLDPEILSLDPAESIHAATERGQPPLGIRLGLVGVQQDADRPDSLGLLRTRHNAAMPQSKRSESAMKLRSGITLDAATTRLRQKLQHTP